MPQRLRSVSLGSTQIEYLFAGIREPLMHIAPEQARDYAGREWAIFYRGEGDVA